jgi:S-methylmethionine-dependent homocysteine/selenocysteine methylase
LAESGVDLLYAPTFASADELCGVSAAMAETGLPYVVAPVLNGDGSMPDGTRLATLIERLDAAPHAAPLHVMIGCVHAGAVATTLSASDATRFARVAGLKANASALPPAELDRLDHVEADSPAEFARQLVELHRTHGLKVLGGCCGTDDRHIRAVATLLHCSAETSTNYEEC